MSEQTAEFLTNWQNDAPRRWSPEDFDAQQRFVNDAVGGDNWSDWSNPMAAMQLIQADLLNVALEDAEKHDAIVLAGPVVELIRPARLLAIAAPRLNKGGRLVGIFPCLRDNSPESQLFMELSESRLWPYFTEEEIREALNEAGFDSAVEESTARFSSVPQFNRAVLKDELGFKGFRHIFDELEKEGYDPIEVGWGELRINTPLAERDT